MPLTDLQAEIFHLIAANRNPDSYVAGGIVIHRDTLSSRYSDDIDLFHDTAQALKASAHLDAEILRTAGFMVTFRIEDPTFHQAVVMRKGRGLRLDWEADSSFRFFPVVSDEILGFRLHDADAAINKVLAAAGREKVRDFIDLIHLDRTYVSLGTAVWAAAGKDEGFTPELIVDQMRRHSRINPATLDGIQLVKRTDAVALKAEWLECLHAAETLLATFPPDSLGCFYLNAQGEPARGNTFDPSWVSHYGSIKGAWPRLAQD